MIRFGIALTTLGVLTGCGVTATVPTTVTGEDLWELVWSEEFEGDALNEATWTPEIGTGAERGIVGWGNNELQYYTARSENIVLSDGTLKITALQEAGDDYETQLRYIATPTF